MAVVHGMLHVKVALMRADARNGNAHIHAGVAPLQPPCVQARGKGILLKRFQPEQSTHADGADAALCRALRRIEPEAVIMLGANGVQPCVKFRIIRLLKHGHAVHACVHQQFIFLGGERIDLHAHRGKAGFDAPGRIRDILRRR